MVFQEKFSAKKAKMPLKMIIFLHPKRVFARYLLKFLKACAIIRLAGLLILN